MPFSLSLPQPGSSTSNATIISTYENLFMGRPLWFPPTERAGLGNLLTPRRVGVAGRSRLLQGSREPGNARGPVVANTTGPELVRKQSERKIAYLGGVLVSPPGAFGGAPVLVGLVSPQP